MSLQKLEENYHLIEDFERLNSNLAAKVEQAKEARCKQESMKYLINFELSRVRFIIEQTKQEVSKLETERERLSKIRHELICLDKQERNLLTLNNIRLEMKEHTMDKLQNKLDTLDFTIEERECDPTRGVNTFSQYVRG